ncbi:hypothetical protein ACIQGZ_17270 [Streptomyces sp. NPDC092296]|uniref:hypothetical protein n=1 Tax=Streptomyces sp. NPDC092296 TaxID=3366012 RepID=UPI0037FD699E
MNETTTVACEHLVHDLTMEQQQALWLAMARTEQSTVDGREMHVLRGGAGVTKAVVQQLTARGLAYWVEPTGREWVAQLRLEGEMYGWHLREEHTVVGADGQPALEVTQ